MCAQLGSFYRMQDELGKAGDAAHLAAVLAQHDFAEVVRSLRASYPGMQLPDGWAEAAVALCAARDRMLKAFYRQRGLGHKVPTSSLSLPL